MVSGLGQSEVKQGQVKRGESSGQGGVSNVSNVSSDRLLT